MDGFRVLLDNVVMEDLLEEVAFARYLPNQREWSVREPAGKANAQRQKDAWHIWVVARRSM